MKLSALVRAASAFRRDEGGATATEYAVMLALVLAVIIASVTVFGQSLATQYGTIDTTLFS